MAAATATSIVLKKEKTSNQPFLGSTMLDIRNMQAGSYIQPQNKTVYIYK
jgi:hypothetical protein